MKILFTYCHRYLQSSGKNFCCVFLKSSI